MAQRLRINGSALIFLGISLMFLPLEWISGFILAVFIHETSHYLMLRILNIPVFAFSIGAGGCKIRTGSMKPLESCICAAAGPLGSFLLTAGIHKFPELAVCGLCHGIFNLIPIEDSDGSRILSCLLGDRITRKVSRITSILLSSAGIFAGIYFKFYWILLPILWKSVEIHGMRKNSLQRQETRCTIELPFSKRLFYDR